MSIADKFNLNNFVGWMACAEELLKGKPIWTAIQGHGDNVFVLYEGKLFGVAIEGANTRFATGIWCHLFGETSAETQCRIIIDVSANKLIAAQEFTGLKYTDIQGARFEDLADSVISANGAGESPKDFGLIETFVLPDWAPPTLPLMIALANAGYLLSKRDENRCPGHSGIFMISDTEDPYGYCLVGDNPGELVVEACSHLEIDTCSIKSITPDDLYELDARAWQDGGWCADGDLDSGSVLENPTFILLPHKAPEVKKIRVCLSALTRVEYTEVILVPADATTAEIEQLIEKRYDNVDGGLFLPDPEYWERGTHTFTDEDTDAIPEGTAIRVNDELIYSN